MPAPWSSDLITMRGGMTVPVGVVQLGCSLELRGFRLTSHGEKLRVTPPKDTQETISGDEREAIRVWKAHFLALLDMKQDTDRDTQDTDQDKNRTRR